MDKRYKHTTRDRALHRLKIIQGHLHAIEEMIEDDKYCVDAIHQSRAVQKALKGVDDLLIEGHLKTCVISQIKNGEEDRSTKELLKLFKYH